jgi:maleate cis-trans isomerase
VVGNVARLERETRKPVVAQLAAILWGCLSQLGQRQPVTGYGRLLETWPSWVEPTVAPNAVESTR